MVLAGTGPTGFPQRRSLGVLNYDAVHFVRGPLTHYTDIHTFEEKSRNNPVAINLPAVLLQVYATALSVESFAGGLVGMFT